MRWLVNELRNPFSSLFPKVTAYAFFVTAAACAFVAIWYASVEAQISPTPAEIRMIQDQGFATYAAWVLLSLVTFIMGFMINQFRDIIEAEREDRNGILAGVKSQTEAVGKDIIRLEYEIVEGRRDGSVQRARIEAQVKESGMYYADNLSGINDKLSEIERRLPLSEKQNSKEPERDDVKSP